MKKFTSSAKSAAINTFKELSEVVDGRTLPKALGPLFYLRRDMNHYRATYDSFLSRADPNKPAYLFFDGASKQNPGPAGAGFALVDDSNNVYGAFSVNTLKATNNEAEYMAALFGVYCARLANIQNLTLIGDSSLVIGHLTGRMQLKAPNLMHYYYPLHHMCKELEKVEFSHVKRGDNKIADDLANKAVKKYTELTIQEKALLVQMNRENRKNMLAEPGKNYLDQSGQLDLSVQNLKEKLAGAEETAAEESSQKN